MSNVILKSKFNFKTILLFVYVILLFGLLSVHMFNRFQEVSKFDFWIFSIFLMFFTLFLTTTLFTLSFFDAVKINSQNLIVKNVFRRRIIPFSLIEKIELSEIIEKYGVLTDSTKIQLINGNSITLYPFKYLDFYNIKIALNNISNTNQLIKIEEPDFKIKTSNLNIKSYNSSHLLSITGILFYGTVIAFVIGLFKNTNPIESFPLFFISFFLLFFLISRDMNYFEVNETHLIIKNSIQFWKKSDLQLDKIKTIEILNFYRRPGYYIVVKTKYYDTKTFHSDNLFDKEWDKFIEHLKSEQIQVIDRRNFSARQTLY